MQIRVVEFWVICDLNKAFKGRHFLQCGMLETQVVLLFLPSDVSVDISVYFAVTNEKCQGYNILPNFFIVLRSSKYYPFWGCICKAMR